MKDIFIKPIDKCYSNGVLYVLVSHFKQLKFYSANILQYEYSSGTGMHMEDVNDDYCIKTTFPKGRY